MVTRKDVAKHAGVSTATVSNVMNNKDIVSEVLKKRVLASVSELGYKPNLLAKSLKTKHSMQIAVVTNDITNPFFTEVITGVESEAFECGYTVTILNVADRDIDVTEAIYERQYDGVFIMTDNVSIEELEYLTSRNIITVLFTNEIIKTIPKDLIILNVNEYSGAKELFDYLINIGHKNIAFYSSRKLKKGIESDDMRLSAYLDSLRENNIEVDKNIMDLSSSSIEGIVETTTRILSSENRPSAIFAGNDHLAMAVIAVARNMGLSVPYDVSVVGFDNIRLSSYFNPRITTVDMPKKNMGLIAFKSMMTKLEEGKTQLIKLPTKLIIRESSAEKKLQNL